MKTKKIMTGLVLLVLCFLLASLSFAQPWRGWRGSGGWGMGTQYQRMFNPATVENLAGEILAIEKSIPVPGMTDGIHLQVKTEKETIAVHLGPEWYIERLDMQFAEGDAIEVKGSRVTFEGKPAIIGAEIKKGDEILVLRNGVGVPVWSGTGTRMR